MSTITELDLTQRVSWGSIIAGVITVIAISLVLSLLGISLGFSMLDPQSSTDISNGSGTAVTIWTLFSLLLSLAAGGFVAGRLAGIDGLIHGFLVWALSLIIGIILSVMTLSSALSITGSAIGSVASATGSVASGVGSIAGKGAGQLFSLGEDVFADVIPKSELQLGDNSSQNIAEALKKSGIPELQPDYLSAQLDVAKDKTTQAVKKLAINPQQSDQIVQDLLASLKQQAEGISSSINRDDVKNAVAKNSSLSPAEADRAVDNFILERQRAAEKINQELNQLEVNIKKAELKYQQLKEQAAETAAQATKAAAKAALWSFIGLVIGALASAFAGRWAVSRYALTKKVIV
ncbi:hypothetical protein EC844_13310 [Acinetobacter calcoaceticus]|uniref:CAP-Gly protein n=1 Tax=Acinetobacter calcoaceticus TaxID=471 RepID=A0A4R1XEZ7_ACICA|nr:hypothetical protein EC844_13310 [Acinetobacter calcoaceticus]